MIDNPKAFIYQGCGHVPEFGPYRLTKPRTPAEAEALVDGIEEAVRHIVGHLDWGEDKEADEWELKLVERRAALIAALTGGGA